MNDIISTNSPGMLRLRILNRSPVFERRTEILVKIYCMHRLFVPEALIRHVDRPSDAGDIIFGTG